MAQRWLAADLRHAPPIFMSAAFPHPGKSRNLDSGYSAGLGSSFPSLGSVPSSSK